MISLGVYIVVASAVFLSNYSVQGQIPETKNYQQIPRCRNPNELWYDLMPTCALTCATVGERCPDPAFSAQVSGCACKPGFHRNGPRDNDPCVTTKQCLSKFVATFRPPLIEFSSSNPTFRTPL